MLSDHWTLPSIVHLTPHVFACVVYVHLHTCQCTKLEPWELKRIFNGYGSSLKGYECYLLSTKKFYVFLDVTFHEHMLFYSHNNIDHSNLRDIWEKVHNHIMEFLEMFQRYDIDTSSMLNERSENSKEASIEWVDCEGSIHDSTLPPISTTISVSQSFPDDSSKVSSDYIKVNSNIHDTTNLNSEPPQYHLPPWSNHVQPCLSNNLV